MPSPRGVPGIELYGPMDPDLRGGVIPFNLPGIHPHDVAQVLDRSGVAVRAGHHCTMPLHERLDLAATARASFSVYSTTEDIDALVAGLLEVQRVFAPSPRRAGAGLVVRDRQVGRAAVVAGLDRPHVGLGRLDHLPAIG